MTKNKSIIVFYDGLCVLCNRSIIWFINHYDPKLKKMKNVTLFYLDKDYNLRKKIQAFRAEWDKKSSNWILFNGNFYDTLQLPNSYILVNFFYKSPEFILFTYLY